jgi:4-phytase/acid phosphatase
VAKTRATLLRVGLWLLVLPSCGGPIAIWGQTNGRPPSKQVSPQQEKLKMVVILSRHGVRSPTWTQARLDSYSVLPWPKWNVPPGNLTARGHQLLTLFGAYDRASLTQAGLLGGHACDDATSTYLWADTDQRTLESGQALFEGLFPGCAPSVHSLAAGESDSLFHPAAEVVKKEQADAAFLELDARVKQQNADGSPQAARRGKLIADIQHLLLGCGTSTACTPAHLPQTPLTGEPTAAARGKGDHVVDLQGPLPTASSFAEDLLLEYADGMPMASVGWGKVDESELRKLLALHTDYFDLIHRTPTLAKIEASNMLFHIVRTLQQGAEGKAVSDAIGPQGARMVLIAGHDTNLAGVAELLGLHWRLDGRDDDTPPGTELAFELWQDARRAYSVRLTVSAQTLTQLRTMQPLTPSAAPAHQNITQPKCASSLPTCTWDAFQHVAEAAIDTRDVLPLQIH